MYYNLEKITEQIYQISSKENVNCQLVVGTEKALLFDTGYGIGKLQEAVEAITRLPIIVVNSHGHIDHINGNDQFEGPIYIHQADLALAQEHSGLERRKEAVEKSKKSVDFRKGTTENIIPEGFEEEAYLNAVIPEWSFVEEGHKFDLGGIVLEVMQFPGHTRGSIGLWDAQDKILFTGDAFSPFTWLFTNESSTLSEYIQSLYKAKALGCEFMLTGHEQGKVLAVNLDYYIDCAEHVDFEKGVPFQNDIIPGEDARICVREGYEPMQFGREGFASLVISKEHLD